MIKCIVALTTLMCLSSLRCCDAEQEEVCMTCSCLSSATTRTIFNIDCSSLSLDRVFPDTEKWPLFARRNSTSTLGRHQTYVSANFEDNKMTSLNRFPELPQLVSLKLSHNSMRDIQESAFMDLENLECLDLSHNNLTADDIRPDVFRGRPSLLRYEPLNLVILNLGYNKIHSLGQRTMEHLLSLTELHLNNNPITMLDPVTQMALSAPNALKVLNLANTGLCSFPEDVTHLPSIRQHLTRLELNGNQLTEVPTSLASLGTTLEVLNLNGNPMTELRTDVFTGLHKLRQLNVSTMPNLTRLGPGAFNQLRSLRSLHCSYNPQLYDIDKDVFAGIKRHWTITELYLNNNNLSGLHEETAPWRKIPVLNLAGNPWRCDCALDFLPARVLPFIKDSSPELALGLHCVEPMNMSGRPLMSLKLIYSSLLEKQSSELCHSELTESWEEDSDPLGHSVVHVNHPHAWTMSVVTVVVASLFTAGAIIVLVFVRRSPAFVSGFTHYSRANTDRY